MQTKSFHITNLGSFSGGLVADTEGYVTIHDSERYGKADMAQLQEWAENGKTQAVRNAAQTEINERALAKWRDR
jgi:hypothetical protein